jgi:hypothetical protein
MRRLSGTHLTIIIVTAMVCLALPTGALAAGLSKVVVAGANGKTAKVTDGRLNVDAKTDIPDVVKTSEQSVVKTSEQSVVKTSQQGPVTSQVAAPGDYVNQYTSNVTSACIALVTAPANAAIVIRQVNVSVWAAPAADSGHWGIVSTSNICSGGLVAGVYPSGNGIYPIAFDPGYLLPAGASLYGRGNNGVSFDVMVSGYRITQ